ncbi:MAG: LysR family transcriptional regulator [Pseudomonadota bacterium]
MDIDLLRTFLEVHKTRHFGKAADNLYLTSAAVSARIKQLEQHLGVILFVRNRGNVQLTGAGERLLPHAESVLAAWARTLQDVLIQPNLQSRLHIGATSGLWSFSLQQKLGELMANFPTVAFRAEGHADLDLIRRLEERYLDLVLVYDPPNTPEFKSTRVGLLKLVLASTTPGKSVRAYFEEGYVYCDWGTSFELFHARKFGEVPPAVLQVNLVSIALSYLAEHPGAVFMPQSLLQANPHLFPVKGSPAFNRPVYATYREGNQQPELIKQVITQIKGISV